MLRFFLTLLKDLNSKKILLRVCVTSIGTSQSVAGRMCTREAGSADPRAEPECVLMAKEQNFRLGTDTTDNS